MIQALQELNGCTRDPNRPESILIGGRSLASSSDSDECFRLACLWLRQCVERHECGAIESGDSQYPDRDYQGSEKAMASSESAKPAEFQAAPPRFMPTRTIEVGPADGSQNPRLVGHKKQEGCSTMQAWATLSHCWGGSAPLKTTLATISQWQRGIPFDLMPPTFRDAVSITRRLGIRHLWIDSLCIIQDSAEDWEFEAARMGNVYRYGLLNVAADTAPSCNGGIMSSRKDYLSSIKIPLISEKHNMTSYMFARSGRWDGFRDDIMGSDSMLNSRAWVLQESLLSPRTLHYGKRQMVWECLNCSLNEGSAIAGANIKDEVGTAYFFSHKMLLPRYIVQQSGLQASTEKDANRRTELYNVWLQVIAQYTKRKLTVYTDIFSALAGIASLLQVHLGDRYLAGLFEGDLARSLLWQVIDPSLAKSASPPLAPSWSWASVVGAVQPGIAVDSSMLVPRSVGSLAAEFISVEIYTTNGKLAPADHFLDAPCGMIVLEGFLLRGRSSRELAYENKTLERIEGDTAHQIAAYNRRNSLHLDMNEDLDERQDLAILHLGAWQWRFEIPTRSILRVDTTFAGLLLRRCEDPAQNEYRRIGVVRSSVRTEQDSLSCAFVEDTERMIAAKWQKEILTIV